MPSMDMLTSRFLSSIKDDPEAQECAARFCTYLTSAFESRASGTSALTNGQLAASAT
jgi:hypothetical protein